MHQNSTSIRREYKDRLFHHLFSDKDNALSLYNALSGTTYTDIENLEIVTLADAIYLSMHDDLAVCFHDSISLFEQQSTVNPNMPLRGLLYLARSYEGWLAQHRREIYGSKQLKIPAPEYYVLYNGTQEMPARMDYHLSDAFAHPAPGYEWTAHMININIGYNPEILGKCKILHEYSQLIQSIRDAMADGTPLLGAVEHAVNDCIQKGILKDYLLRHKAEVTSMILTEYDEELFKQTMREEGREEGFDEGKIAGKREGKIDALSQSLKCLMKNMNLSMDQAFDALGVSDSDRQTVMRML